MILDSIGGKNLADSIGALAYRGTLVSVGVAGRDGSAVEAKDLWGQQNTLRSVFLGGAMLTESPRIHAMIADLFERVASGGCASRSTGPSRSPTPPPRTSSSRAARPSVAS